MHLIGLGILDDFKALHPDSAGALDTWVELTRQASWRMGSDVTSSYPKTSGITDSRFIFNIRGNRYRLLVKVAFNTGVVRILRVGTHADYNSWKL